MSRPDRRFGLRFVIVAALLASPPAGAEEGVWISRIEPGSAIDRAGLRVGDRLLAWRQATGPPKRGETGPPAGGETGPPKRGETGPPAGGEIGSGFDWRWLRLERAPRGPVTLIGQRAADGSTDSIELQVEVGSWDAEVRPHLPDDAAEAYRAGAEGVAAGEVDLGATAWRELSDALKVAPDSDRHRLHRCWLQLRIGEVLAQAQSWEAAHAAFEAALAEAREPSVQAEILDAVGGAQARQNAYDEASASFTRALELRRAQQADSLAVAQSRYELSRLALRRGQLELAAEHLAATLELRQKLAPHSLELSDTLNNQGTVAWYRGELDKAAAIYQQGLDLRQKLAPGSVHVAASLNNLGLVAWQRGELELAEEFQQRAMKIRQRLAPHSLEIAASWMNLGNLAWARGDMALAEARWRSTLELREKLAPGSLDVALSLNNLGLVAWHRGELARAEAHYRRSFEIRQRLAPESLEAAASLNNLGVLARIRGDLELARDHYQRSFEIRQKLAPDSLDVAATLINLGTVAQQSGEIRQAQIHYQDALELQQRHAPDSLDVAACLTSLGLVQAERDQLEAAEQYLRRALDIRQRQAPGSLSESETLRYLGGLVEERDATAAMGHYESALAIARRLAPNGLGMVEVLTRMGALARSGGELDTARSHFEAALGALEVQMGRLGGSQELKGDFRDVHGSAYQHLIEIHLAAGRDAEAFGIVERSRARSFLEMLAERDLVFSADIPTELESRRRRNAVLYDRTQQKLATLSPAADGEAIDGLLRRLRELRQEREQIASEIRGASPELAALSYPQPLDLAAAQRALDPGTVLLSYSVGASQIALLAVTRDTSEGVVVPLGGEELRREVELFRRLIQSTAGDLSSQIETVGARLYRHLIAPVEPLIEAGQRLLIVADGPLYALPFAALVREPQRPMGSTESRPAESRPTVSKHRLVQWRPVHTALSATVYAQLQARRPGPTDEPPELLLAAFGDPLSSGTSHTPTTRNAATRSPVTRSPVTRSPATRDSVASASVAATTAAASQQRAAGIELGPLPSSRREVERIAQLFPAERVRVFLGAQATEEQAKRAVSRARTVHFATHGLIDPRFPLDSGLVLSPPESSATEQGNGLLQAWEIFESLRLEADLVVLSACESGLGDEQGGEGLIGLTRAFQYAGARSVVSTLWPVNDAVTAELMVRFYRHLRAGSSQDTALQMAQIELIEGPIQVPAPDGTLHAFDASSPRYWAALQITGDWR
ncbi:MAG: CHAT domain-containing protein [Acidobacteriota bacterium]